MPPEIVHLLELSGLEQERIQAETQKKPRSKHRQKDSQPSVPQAPLRYVNSGHGMTKSIDLRSTHPTTPEHFIGIEKTIAEIQGKIERNMPLEPEFQKEDQEDNEEEDAS